MTDLDQLLAEEARRDRLDPLLVGPVGDAVGRARISTRRRYTGMASLALAAVAVTGASAYYVAAGSAPQRPRDARLAAYDHVLGPDRAHPGYLEVVGPADQHTAHCTRVSGAHVYYRQGSRAILIRNGHASPTGPGQLSIPGFPDHMPPGPYYLFRCPNP